MLYIYSCSSKWRLRANMSKSAAMVLLYVKWLLEVGAIVSSYS